MNEIIVRFIAMPRTIKGNTTVDSEGDYNVYINSVLPRELQEKAYQHELAHIKLNHLFDERPIEVKEAEAEDYRINCLSKGA